MYLYHYFEKERGPFRCISDLPEEEARNVFYNMIDRLEKKSGMDFKREEDPFLACRPEFRRMLEIEMRQQFAEKGGRILRQYPYYMMLIEDASLNTLWGPFINPDFIKIPVAEIDMSTVSFTFGDSMLNLDPSSRNEREYWQKIYTYDEILKVIKECGNKTNLDPSDVDYHFIEAQLWSDESIQKYKQSILYE